MAVRESEAPVAEQARLRRHVGPVGLLFAGVGSIIGSGWLFGALTAATLAGPAAIFSWVIAGVMILLIGLTYAELGTMFPISGGVVRYPHLSFGSFASYSMGWITWVASVAVPAIEVEGALQYATKYAAFTTKHAVAGQTVHTLTPLGYVVAVLLMAVFVIINYVGVRFFAQINNALVWWKLAIISLVIIMFFITAFHGVNFSSHGFTPMGWPGVFTAIATGGITFSYLGFRQGIELAGETTNPHRNVPLAVIGSVLLTGVIYVLLQIAFIGAVRPSDLEKSGGWAKLAFANDFGPLAAIATIIGLSWLAILLYIDAVVSPADTGLIYTAVASRVSYAMGRNRNAPQWLAHNNKHGVPYWSLVVTFIAGLVLLLPFPSWQQLVGFITSATVLSFGTGPLVFSAMRRELPGHTRAFRLWGGDVIPFLAFYSSNLIVYWATWAVDSKLFLAVLLGYVLLVIFHFSNRGEAPRIDWLHGATWVIPWFAGMALISWLGDGRQVWSFFWNFPIILIWSAIVYAIAIRFRLPRARVEEYVEHSRHESEEVHLAV